MKASGIVRRVDDLGRIVIPEVIRERLNIEAGQPMELFYEADAVLFRKYDPAETSERVIEKVLRYIEDDDELSYIQKQNTKTCLEKAIEALRRTEE